MKNYYARLISFVILISISLCLSKITSVNAQDITPTPAPSELEKHEIEIAVLQAQLDLMRQYDQRLLETVYWSLGTVAAIVLGLIAINWFTNNRIYDKDRIALRQEIENYIKQETAKINESLQIDSSQRINNIEAKANQAVTNATKEINTQINSVSQRITELNLKIKLTEAQSWQEKDVPLNSIQRCLDVLEEAKPPYPYEVEEALGLLYEAIIKANNNKDKLLIYDITRLKNTLDKLPNKFDLFKEKILKEI